MDLKGRNFLTLKDFTPEEITYLLDLSAELKEKKKKGIPVDKYRGMNVALIFEKTSTRTRCSFEVAAHDMGMGTTYLDPSGSQIGKKESIEDTARVLGRMYEGIEYRGFGQDIVEELAKKYTILVTLLCDTNHVISSDYSEVIVVGAGADAVDYKLISMCHKGDMVVSQDYGVAAMALGKGAYAIHQSGKWYTNENIDQMLMERHLNKKARRASQKNHFKGPKKRTEEDDERLAQSFERMVKAALEESE